MKNNIVLIGYMGCGKTSVGKRLAQILQYEFLDTDQWIEEKEKISISQIFDRYGEEYFRDLETKCVEEIMKLEKGKVISVGGGLPLRERNRSLLKQLGVVIYLKAEPDTIYERVKGDASRPLLQTENPRGKIEEMMKLREDKYRKAAHRILAVDNKSFEEILSEIAVFCMG